MELEFVNSFTRITSVRPGDVFKLGLGDIYLVVEVEDPSQRNNPLGLVRLGEKSRYFVYPTTEIVEFLNEEKAVKVKTKLIIEG